MKITALRLATVAVLGFLLVTNPVVVDAAGKITSAGIKNGTIKSVDVKDGGLRAKDFKAGELPQGPPGPAGQLGAFGQIAGPTLGAAVNLTSTYAMVSDSALVSVPQGGRLVAAVTASLRADAPGSGEFMICYRPAGTSAWTAFEGGAQKTPVSTANSIVAVSATAGFPALSAGSYEVALCVRQLTAALGLGSGNSSGWVQVLPVGTPFGV